MATDEPDDGNLANRTEAILRRDRYEFRDAYLQLHPPVLVLALLPANHAIIDLMDAYVGELIHRAGLQYVRPAISDLDHLAPNLLTQARLVLADMSEPCEAIVATVYKAFAKGRPVLLTAQSAERIPWDLVSAPSVLYGLEPGQFDYLLREVERATGINARESRMVR